MGSALIVQPLSRASQLFSVSSLPSVLASFGAKYHKAGTNLPYFTVVFCFCLLVSLLLSPSLWWRLCALRGRTRIAPPVPFKTEPTRRQIDALHSSTCAETALELVLSVAAVNV